MFRNNLIDWSTRGALLTAILVTAIAGGTARADFTFGKPVDLTEGIPVLDPAYENVFCFSSDG